jgi:DNA-binding response OmpR family regulator
MHILIIEDEKKTSSFLRKGLTKSGYVVDTEENGDDGLLFVYLIAIYRLVDLMPLKWAKYPYNSFQHNLLIGKL